MMSNVSLTGSSIGSSSTTSITSINSDVGVGAGEAVRLGVGPTDVPGTSGTGSGTSTTDDSDTVPSSRTNDDKLTADQVATLDEYWNAGLTSYRSTANKKHVVEISKRTGLSAKRIKRLQLFRELVEIGQEVNLQQHRVVPRYEGCGETEIALYMGTIAAYQEKFSRESWINNQKTRQYRQKFGNHRRTPSLKPRKKSAYSCFLAEYLSAQGSSTDHIMRDANEAWKLIKGTSRESQYTVMAERKNKDRVPEIEPSQRASMKRKIGEEIKNLCTKLQDIGCEAFCVIVDGDGNETTTGTDNGMSFMSGEDDLLIRFGLSVTGRMLPANKESLANLRTQVQEVFNKKYYEATGKAKFSYKRLAIGEIRVEGLPSGILFKRPSAYGMSQLFKILQHKDDIFVYLSSNTTPNAVGTDDHQPQEDLSSNTTPNAVGTDDHQPQDHDGTDHAVEILNAIITGETEETGDYFPIEKICKRRKKNGTVQYFVKWEGFPKEQGSWVDEKDVTKEALDAFRLRSRKSSTN